MAEKEHTAPSAYLLECSIPPGVVRRGDVYAFGELRGVLRCLRQTFVEAPSVLRAHEAYLALCHEASILLWVVDQGKIRACIDIRNYMSLVIGGTKRVSLKSNNVSASANRRLGFGLIRSAGAVFRIDEDGIDNAIAPLRKPWLGADQTLTVRDDDLLYLRPTCLGAGEVLRAGKNDLEHDMVMGHEYFAAGLMRLGTSMRSNRSRAG